MNMKFRITFEGGSELETEAPSWITALYIARAHARQHQLPEVPISMVRLGRPLMTVVKEQQR